MVFLMVVVVPFLIVAPAFAATLPEEDIRAIDLGTEWHKTYKPVRACATAGPTNTNGSGGSGQPGALYLLGDSIGTQFGSALATSLSGQGWTAQTNAVSGRTLPEGLAAIDQDAAIIQASDIVVIELGTNTGGFSPENVAAAIDKIRFLKADATIYWVDTVVVQRQDYAQSLNNVNSIIYAQSAQKNYQVVSWNKKVFGEGADPQNINADAPDNGYIRQADQFVHLTNEGVTAMVELVGGIVTAAGIPTANCPSGAPSCLVGGDNREKIWHYLIGRGLTPPQAAGIIGNLSVESSFDPFNQENSKAWEDGGWGIAQWTAGRRNTIRDVVIAELGAQFYVPTEEAGAMIGTADEDNLLFFQLEFLFSESNSRVIDRQPTSGFVQPPPGTNEWEGLKTMKTVEEAILYWEWNFERAGVPALGARLAAGNQAVSDLGSLAPTGSGAC
jgi:lysophospholipase L1-like esterase